MHYYGAVYRPPSEAYSLIVQCTLGCSHNKCAFCNMYKDKKFSIRPVEEVLRDLAEARSYERRIERIFLADGDALILPMDYLLQVLDFIREYFPECTRVAAYATTKAIERKTDEELRKLREHGLALVYIGLESGNEELLLKFNKGVTAAETVKNALRCKAAGIAISVTAINGMAGLNGDWQAHAIDTAKAVSAMKPEFIAFLTLRVYSGTPLHDWIEAGEFQMMGPADLMRETRLFLEHIDSEGSVFRSNHASNYLPLGGTLNRDREALIQTIDAALDALGEERYQYFGFNGRCVNHYTRHIPMGPVFVQDWMKVSGWNMLGQKLMGQLRGSDVVVVQDLNCGDLTGAIQDILDEEFTDVPPEGIAPPGEDFECQVLYRKSKYA